MSAMDKGPPLARRMADIRPFHVMEFLAEAGVERLAAFLGRP